MNDGKIPLRRSTEPTKSTEPPKYPTDVIPLVTHGWFYEENHPLASGEIEIKQMTAREEDILANQELIRKGKVLDHLLRSLIVNREINIKDILNPDKNAIFIAIRRFAYGDTYSVNLNCPACSKRTQADINLAELAEKPLDLEKFPKGKNSFPFTLPNSKTQITYKLLNQVDEDLLEKELEGLRKINKESAGELTTRLKHIITAVDGDSEPATIRSFVDEQLLAKDSRALREYIRDNTPNIDMTFDFKCNECSLERRLEVPIGASFLWPDFES